MYTTSPNFPEKQWKAECAPADNSEADDAALGNNIPAAFAELIQISHDAGYVLGVRGLSVAAHKVHYTISHLHGSHVGQRLLGFRDPTSRRAMLPVVGEEGTFGTGSLRRFPSSYGPAPGPWDDGDVKSLAAARFQPWHCRLVDCLHPVVTSIDIAQSTLAGWLDETRHQWTWCCDVCIQQHWRLHELLVILYVGHKTVFAETIINGGLILFVQTCDGQSTDNYDPYRPPIV